MKKLHEDEHFEGLDLISKLLTIPREDELRERRNLIEVLDSRTNDLSNRNLNDDDDHGDQPAASRNDDYSTVNSIYDSIFDENLELNQFVEATKSILDTKFKYGFLNSYSELIEKYQDELWQLADLKNPGELSIEERRKQRLDKENHDFDEECYLNDQFEDNKLIDNLRLQDSWWLKSSNDSFGEPNFESSRRTFQESNYQSFKDHKSSNELNESANSRSRRPVAEPIIKKDELKFTEDEIFRLKNLPRKEFAKLTKEEKVIIMYGLVDILYAYCYDLRINEGR